MTVGRARKVFALGATSAIAAIASSHALAACDHLEFAEMDAMTKEELLDLRCQYTQSEFNAASRSMANPDELKRCTAEIPRMDRILARKYKLSAGRLPVDQQILFKCGDKVKVP